MSKLLFSIALIPVIYLLVASLLVLWPQTLPDTTHKGLNFDVLSTQPDRDEQYTVRHYQARDHRQLFYRHLSGHSPLTLVLLHGSGTEGRYLLPLAKQLQAKLGIEVIVPDLRGHGLSQGDQPGDITYIGQFEDDLEDLYQHLKQTKPDSTLVLAGHSSGGGLVLKYAGSQRSAYSANILLAPYLGYQAPTVRPNSGGWVHVAKRRYAGLAMLNNVGITQLNHYPVLFFRRPDDFNDPMQLAHYSYRLNQSLSPQDYRHDFSNIQHPMLLLVGENDEAFYPHAYQAILDSYAPETDFYIVPQAQHLDLPNDDASVNLIKTWLNKRIKR